MDAPAEVAGRRRRLHRRSTYALILAGYALYSFGRLTPQPFHEVGAIRETAAWLASLSEALQFHWTLLLAVAVGTRVVLDRDWRPVVAVAPLVIWILVLPMLHGATEECVPDVTCPGRDDSTRITSANLLVGNHGRAKDVADELIGTKSDVLVLQEYSTAWDTTLRPLLERAEFVEVEAETREDSFGLAVYARRDVDASARRLVLGSGDAPQFRIAIEHDGDEFALFAIHTLPPLSRSYSIDGRHEFGQLLDRLSEELGPHLLVGDFNSTRASAQYRALIDRSYTDAWERHGDGRGATWRPAALTSVFPGLGLDHVYVRGAVQREGDSFEPVGSIDTGTPRLGRAHGSDHRPVTVDVAVVGHG